MAIALTAPGEQKFVACFLTVWLSGWSVGVFFLVSQVIQAWRGVRRGSAGSKAAAAGGAVLLTLFSIPFIGGEIFAIIMLGTALTPLTIAILVAVGGSNYLFHHLLKAPTSAGRQLLDKIDGFKMFLAAASEDQMIITYAPMKTPDLYEKYLLTRWRWAPRSRGRSSSPRFSPSPPSAATTTRAHGTHDPAGGRSASRPSPHRSAARFQAPSLRHARLPDRGRAAARAAVRREAAVVGTVAADGNQFRLMPRTPLNRGMRHPRAHYTK